MDLSDRVFITAAGEKMPLSKAGQDPLIESFVDIAERLYRSSDLGCIDFAECARSLTDYLFRSYNASPETISPEVELRDVAMGIEMAVPCGLIINELISNALKHAFPNGRECEIRIGLSSNEVDQFTYVVSDVGVSVPEGLDLCSTP